MRYLDERHRQSLRTVAEERERFTSFYRIVLGPSASRTHRWRCSRKLVQGDDDEVAMEPFPEVAGVLGRLRDRGLRLGVLSGTSAAAGSSSCSLRAPWSTPTTCSTPRWCSSTAPTAPTTYAPMSWPSGLPILARPDPRAGWPRPPTTAG
jgi:hypothetical protein